MGDHLEGLRNERPPHGGLDILIDLFDSSAGFFLGDQLDAWQDSSGGTPDNGIHLAFPPKTSREVV